MKNRRGIAQMRVHSRRRMLERGRMKLTRNVRASILSAIRSGRAERIGDGSRPDRSIYRVEMRKQWWIHVVYDHKADDIVTILYGTKYVG